jgi:hypothetical protein
MPNREPPGSKLKLLPGVKENRQVRRKGQFLRRKKLNQRPGRVIIAAEPEPDRGKREIERKRKHSPCLQS